MRRRDASHLVFLCLSLALALLSLRARAEAGNWSDSGIQGAPYLAIRASLGRLALGNPGLATVITYGATPGGLPLTLVKIEDKAAAAALRQAGALPEKRPVVLITGATHGNEFLHVEDRLPAFFVGHRGDQAGVRDFLARGGVLLIVPVVNPDGYERHTRDNLHDVDLNRDFALLPTREGNFREVETRALAARIDQELQAGDERLALSVDYHCCAGSLLYPWAYSEDALPKGVLKSFMAIADLMLKDIDPHYSTGPTGQILGYLPRGTSKDYYYAKFGALAFTYEGDYQTEAAKFPRHAVWWNHVLAKLVRP